MPTKRQEKERLFQLIGWVLFLICSFLFIADSLAARSPWGLAGSIAFSLGCIIFLVPLTWKKE